MRRQLTDATGQIQYFFHDAYGLVVAEKVKQKRSLIVEEQFESGHLKKIATSVHRTDTLERPAVIAKHRNLIKC